MRVLIEDTLATSPFTISLAAGWIELDRSTPFEVRVGLRGGELAPDDVALIGAAEWAGCQTTHQVVPDFAVVTDGVSAISLRTPVRPDQIERTPVRVVETDSTAEMVARATLRPFYGINASEWIRREDDPRAATAQVVIVDSFAALRPPEAGYAEDLGRAWFILTGLPLVTHVLVAPILAERESLAAILGTLGRLLRIAIQRRREWQPLLAERYDLPEEVLAAFFTRQRYAVTEADRAALIRLHRRGGIGLGDSQVSVPIFLAPSSSVPPRRE